MSAAHQLIAAGFLFALGASLGSFLNVCAYRIPRSMSVLRPASRCPGCGGAIAPRDNLPVLGWILLRGRCRGCGSAIAPRYPIVEAAVGLLAACSVLAAGPADPIELGPAACLWLLARGLALPAFLVTGTLMAIDGRAAPPRLAALGCAAALLLAATRPGPLGGPGVLDPALGMLVAGGAALASRRISMDRWSPPPPAGPVDPALAATVGAFVGLRALGPVLAIALLGLLALALLRSAWLAWSARSARALPTPDADLDADADADADAGRLAPRLGPMLGLAGLLPLLAGPWPGPS